MQAASKPWRAISEQTKITEELARNIYYTVMPDDTDDLTAIDMELITKEMLRVARLYN